jgi:tRNA 2-thiouridine synthesizing protein E
MNNTLFDQDGFIRDPGCWDETLAREIAAREGITQLDAAHWAVIHALRKHYFETDGVPVMRYICREAGLKDHCVSELLADPRLAWRIAGLPNPGEEAKAYMETAEFPDRNRSA